MILVSKFYFSCIAIYTSICSVLIIQMIIGADYRLAHVSYYVLM